MNIEEIKAAVSDTHANPNKRLKVSIHQLRKLLTDRTEALADFVEECKDYGEFEAELTLHVEQDFNETVDIPDLFAIADAMRDGQWEYIDAEPKDRPDGWWCVLWDREEKERSGPPTWEIRYLKNGEWTPNTRSASEPSWRWGGYLGGSVTMVGGGSVRVEPRPAMPSKSMSARDMTTAIGTLAEAGEESLALGLASMKRELYPEYRHEKIREGDAVEVWSKRPSEEIRHERINAEKTWVMSMTPLTAKAILAETIGAIYCALEDHDGVPARLHPADIIDKHLQRGNIQLEGVGVPREPQGPDLPLESLGQYIRDARTHARISLRVAAQTIGMSAVALGEVERGLAPLLVERWGFLAQLLPGVTIEGLRLRRWAPKKPPTVERCDVCEWCWEEGKVTTKPGRSRERILQDRDRCVRSRLRRAQAQLPDIGAISILLAAAKALLVRDWDGVIVERAGGGDINYAGVLEASRVVQSYLEWLPGE